MEEEELDLMETDQKVDQREMKKLEEELLSENEDENELVFEYTSNADDQPYIDSPYPSDVEDFDEDDFVITDRLQDMSVHSSDESVVPVNELAKKLELLKSTDSSPKQPMVTSSPLPPVLVPKECTGKFTI